MEIRNKKQINDTRLDFAKRNIEDFGYEVLRVSEKELQFEHNGNLIKFFPFTGWATGRGIKDGRGLENLLNQLEHGE